MIVSLLSAAVIVAGASAATPSPAAVAPASQPLRQVSYKVSWGTRRVSGGEHYEGYSSQTTADRDEGTITVAVMAVRNEALAVEVTEVMNKTGRSTTFDGAVTPDGAVAFAPDTINDVSRELLQYFAPHFMPSDKTDVGAGWDVDYDKNGVSAKNAYKITKIDGDLVTISEQQSVKVAATNGSMTTSGTVTLKPSLLVPISGDLRRITRQTGVNGNTSVDLTMQFERLSDTRDGPAR